MKATAAAAVLPAAIEGARTSSVSRCSTMISRMKFVMLCGHSHFLESGKRNLILISLTVLSSILEDSRFLSDHVIVGRSSALGKRKSGGGRGVRGGGESCGAIQVSYIGKRGERAREKKKRREPELHNVRLSNFPCLPERARARARAHHSIHSSFRDGTVSDR